jgi:cytochrome P450
VTNANATATEFRDAREASGPPDVSLWSVLRGRRSDPYERWTQIRREHGAIARYRFALADSYLVTSAEGVKRVLQDNAANYTKDHPAYATLRRLFGNGLLTSEGTFWLRQRRLAQPAFHKERIAAMGAMMTKAALETSERFRVHASSGEPVSLLEEMSRLTLAIVGDALFGASLAGKSALVQEAWNVMNAQLVERFSKRRLLPPILPTAYDRAFRRAQRTLFSLVDAIIAERRSASGGDDLLSMLMNARDAETGEGMTDAQLRDEVVTMLLAGHETTAVALAWTWARLDLHRDVAARLHDELDRVLAGRPPTSDDVAKLGYTRSVIEETLRLHPPAYIFQRRATRDDVVCGRRVHAGGNVVISPLVLHRHPDYWDEPDAFRPERWADAAAEKQRPRFAYIPFSAGPRQCIGNAFSMMESVLVLATLAQRFEPRLVTPRLPETEYLVLARPKGDVRATIHATCARPRSAEDESKEPR